jgi:hypothetical protein
VPHAHCPCCKHRVTQVATYWTVGPHPRTQHVTCPSCGEALARPATGLGEPQPWTRDEKARDHQAQRGQTYTDDPLPPSGTARRPTLWSAGMTDDHPTTEPDEDEYGKVPTPDEPAGEDEPPPDERDDG